MKEIILVILIILLLIFILGYIQSESTENFKSSSNNNLSILSKYNCSDTDKLKDKYFNVTQDTQDIDISQITNNTNEIDDKYFKINYYSSRDQDNKPIKLASIKSYLGLPGYITANINDDINKELGDFKYFNKNYKINIEEQMKNKLVSVGYNYIFDNN